MLRYTAFIRVFSRSSIAAEQIYIKKTTYRRAQECSPRVSHQEFRFPTSGLADCRLGRKRPAGGERGAATSCRVLCVMCTRLDSWFKLKAECSSRTWGRAGEAGRNNSRHTHLHTSTNLHRRLVLGSSAECRRSGREWGRYSWSWRWRRFRCHGCNGRTVTCTSTGRDMGQPRI